jgi:Eco29kI restriction endonuclease
MLRDVSTRCHPFNPLDRVELIRSVGRAMPSSPCEQLPPERFEGAGIYAIYYQGDFDPYRPVALAGAEWPIYVGRAMPAGEQWGLADLDTSPSAKLYERLRQHHNSVKVATNLEEDDFQCRYLVIDDIWIPQAERLLIDHYKPLWNGVVNGFGIRAPRVNPGCMTGRAGQKSAWDILHPGRPIANGRATGVSGVKIRARIAEHLDAHPPQSGHRVLI